MPSCRRIYAKAMGDMGLFLDYYVYLVDDQNVEAAAAVVQVALLYYGLATPVVLVLQGSLRRPFWSNMWSSDIECRRSKQPLTNTSNLWPIFIKIQAV